MSKPLCPAGSPRAIERIGPTCNLAGPASALLLNCRATERALSPWILDSEGGVVTDRFCQLFARRPEDGRVHRRASRPRASAAGSITGTSCPAYEGNGSRRTFPGL